jgi:hypothetical protein
MYCGREFIFLPTVKQSTYISYESYVRLHLEPALGTSKLTALTIEQLRRFFNQKKQTLSPKSLRNIYNMLAFCKHPPSTIEDILLLNLTLSFARQLARVQVGVQVLFLNYIFRCACGTAYNKLSFCYQFL